jgi:riboflavin kinase/FMN adenylyltransferase
MTIPILDHRDPVPPHLHGAIFALGNFDGFHLGHQAVVGAAVEMAREADRPAIVATFDPHPMRMFKPDAAPFRLTTLAQRAELFAAAGADAMLVFHFDAALAALTAPEFAALLAGPLRASGVVTGQDFTFGKDRGGNAAALAELGAAAGFFAHTIGPVSDDEGPISSSRIRAALQEGDCETATRLLTRPFAIRGPVIHGAKLGRTIGYPTANLDMANYLRPKYGIYAVTARLEGGSVVPGAANLGIRPTFDPPVELLETYLLEWSGDLYGQEIEIALHHYLRPEAKFDSLDALSAQMAQDCDAARKVLSAAAT